MFNLPNPLARTHSVLRFALTLFPLSLTAVLLVVTSPSGIAQTAHLSSATTQNFGSVSIGTASSPATLTFTFDTAGVLGSTSVVTQGATGLDFTDAGTGSCTAGHSYAAGATCTVKVTLKPRYAGTRYGAALLNTSAGVPFATAYLQGTGMGPQANIYPYVESEIFSGPEIPEGLAIDSGGNLYFGISTGDQATSQIWKETPSAGGYTKSVILTGVNPGHFTLDGGGALYTIDSTHSQVLKQTPSSSGYVATVVASSGLTTPSGIALDGSGNIYIADYSTGEIVKETLSAGSYTQSVIVSGLTQPVSVGVDGDGNVYINDNAGNIFKETLAAGAFTQKLIGTSLAGTNLFAVDGRGNLWTVDANSGDVVELVLQKDQYFTSSEYYLNTGPWGVAIDGRGRVFISGFNIANAGTVVIDIGVWEEDVFPENPTLHFNATDLGTTSIGSPQPATVYNIGNQDLLLTVPSTGTNPSIPSNFLEDKSAGYNPALLCPILTPSSPGPVIPGLSDVPGCFVPVEYKPSAEGTVSSLLTVTDNDLNAAPPSYATHTFTLLVDGIVTVFNDTGKVSTQYGSNTFYSLCAAAQSSVPQDILGVEIQFSGANLQFNPAENTADAVYANGSLYPDLYPACTTITPTAAGNLVATATLANYPSSATFNVSVAPAPLRVSVHPPSAVQTYGTASLPAFTNIVTGLVNGDTVGGTIAVTDQTSVTASSPVGTYPVTPVVSGSAAGNYSATSTDANITITRAPLTILATSQAITYGRTPIPLTYSLYGFVNGDTASVVSGAPILSTTVTSTTPRGVYPIDVQVGSLSAVNYKFVPAGPPGGVGAVRVYKAPLTVTANSVTMTEGGTVPPLTYTITGFVNGEDPSVVSGTATLSTTATSGSTTGDYPISVNVGPLSAENYYFVPAVHGGVVKVVK